MRPFRLENVPVCGSLAGERARQDGPSPGDLHGVRRRAVSTVGVSGRVKTRDAVGTGSATGEDVRVPMSTSPRRQARPYAVKQAARADKVDGSSGKTKGGVVGDVVTSGGHVITTVGYLTAGGAGWRGSDLSWWWEPDKTVRRRRRRRRYMVRLEKLISISTCLSG